MQQFPSLLNFEFLFLCHDTLSSNTFTVKQDERAHKQWAMSGVATMKDEARQPGREAIPAPHTEYGNAK